MVGTALITGTTSGIGKALTEKFASKGNSLILVSRDKDKLQEQAAGLQSRYGIAVQIIVCDLTEEKAAEYVAESVRVSGHDVDILVNNAGFNEVGEFMDTNLSNELDIIQIQIKTITVLTKKLLPNMVRRGYGHIVNVGSTASYMPCPGDAVYAAAKAYVLSFSEALYNELRGTGVTVTCLCPGATNTRFAGKAGIP